MKVLLKLVIRFVQMRVVESYEMNLDLAVKCYYYLGVWMMVVG